MYFAGTPRPLRGHPTTLDRVHALLRLNGILRVAANLSPCHGILDALAATAPNCAKGNRTHAVTPSHFASVSQATRLTSYVTTAGPDGET